MRNRLLNPRILADLALVWVVLASGAAVFGQGVELAHRRFSGPYGPPRPGFDARHVPLNTSIYVELTVADKSAGDVLLPDSVALGLQPANGEPVQVLAAGQRFAQGASGWVRPIDRGGTPAQTLALYAELPGRLEPATDYTIHLEARSIAGRTLPAPQQHWTFTTEAPTRSHRLTMTLDLDAPRVTWQGAFFSGFCNVVFATSSQTFGPTYDMMRQARQEHPRAWSLQRDINFTGSDTIKPPWHQLMDPRAPNLVEEQQTRRITAIEAGDRGTRLRVEDFFGHQQYGITPGRPLSLDYTPGQVVLVSDGAHDARAKVLAVDDTAGSIEVETIATPAGGWRLPYLPPGNSAPDPDAPGLFAGGGCFLRRFDPPGTPVYFWDRLDKEWDLAVKRDGRRLIVNFVDAFSTLSVNGRAYSTAKDYAQWHQVVHTITSHLIERYGETTMTFYWSVFNEPDIVGDYWRHHWDEAQHFYDYTVDAVLRAFEDHGYDSRQVKVGGLELGAIFGTNLRLAEFLAHCSPRAQAPEVQGALPLNAAYADQRLEGRRSRRVEDLCRAHGGRGSPLDFISIHTYDHAADAVAKLTRAKQMALEVDAGYYRDLWVTSFESCPGWAPPPDIAARDSYLGNGYYVSWCADVVRRQLQQGAADPRYAMGETILTTWPPPQDLAGLNVFTHQIRVDDTGDGQADRTETLPLPIFHAVNLLAATGPQFWVIPEQRVGAHVLAGFASLAADGTLRVVLYNHHAQDTQSRSEAQFEVTLVLQGSDWFAARVRQYRFDRAHHSYFQLARALLDERAHRSTDAAALEAAQAALASGDPAEQRKLIDLLPRIGPHDLRHLAGPIITLIEQTRDDVLRADLLAVASRLGGRGVYSAAEVERLREQVELRPITSRVTPAPAGSLRLDISLAANGTTFLVLRAE